MNDRLQRLENELATLAREVAALHDRLERLEGRTGHVEAEEPAAIAPSEALPSSALPSRESDTTAVVSLIGRTLVVLAGAYLLRALTESETIAQSAGVAIGMLYALTWIVMADLAGAAGRRVSAGFHGVAFVLIALPLLFEATVRFNFLGPAASAAGLGIFAAVSLGTAARRRLRGLAWITTAGALFTTFGLMILTAELGPYAVYLVLLGVATLWLGYVLDWLALRWPVALATDLTILVLSFRAVSARAADTPGTALAVQVLLLAAYLGSFGARTLFLNRDVIPFEVLQSVAIIVVGLGGAAYVTRTTGVGSLPLGAATLVLGAAAYAVAVAFVERRQRRRRNFYFYTSAALVFTMAGCALVLPPAMLAVVWALLALVAAVAGRRAGSVTFQSHAAVYATGAAIACHLFEHALHGLGLPIPMALHHPGGVSLVVLAIVAACTWVIGAREIGAPDYERIPRLLLLVVTVGGIIGLMTDWIVPAVATTSSAAIDPGIAATLRTALLVGGVLVLAWAAGAVHCVEAGWLVYPLLVVIGLKFVFEDLQVSRPATLFLAFALYGTALIWGPRLRRVKGAPAPPAGTGHESEGT
jgi:hypothetical protein